MDINLARTFLAIVDTGSFLRAAERLNVTQTSVSARVKTLEELLGRQIFVRNRSGAALTPAGENFSPYANGLVQLWERARQQVAVPEGRSAMVSVGCEASLWDPLLLQWMLEMKSKVPQLGLRTEVGVPQEMLEKVSAGLLDIAIAYAPQQLPGLRIELLIEEKLVMVSTDKRLKTPAARDYVYVDWGAEFARQHHMAFPQLSYPAVRAGLGPLGRQYLLEAGGTGYFRLDVVQAHLDAKRLFRVPDMPEFLYPAYAVYAAESDAAVLKPALAAFKRVARVKPGA